MQSVQSLLLRQREIRVLNLFAYTGVASLLAAKAGAEVTHLDASKRAVGWANTKAAGTGCVVALNHSAARAAQSSGSGTLTFNNCSIYSNCNRIAQREILTVLCQYRLIVSPER